MLCLPHQSRALLQLTQRAVSWYLKDTEALPPKGVQDTAVTGVLPGLAFLPLLGSFTNNQPLQHHTPCAQTASLLPQDNGGSISFTP